MKNRRIAVIDTKFPWMLSGFRYWENYYIQEECPDTVFIAIQPHTDPFPAKVYSFSEIEDVIIKYGITDLYCVFLNLVLSLLGKNELKTGAMVPGSNILWCIIDLINKYNLKLHTTLYPGGGLDPRTNKSFIERVGSECKTVFTNVDEVMNVLPQSIYIPGIINTEFYNLEEKSQVFPIHLIFCAVNAPRKGFSTLVNAFNQLNEDFHIHIVGNWESELNTIKNKNFTFYGVLNPLQLRQLYKKCHVFISCSTEDENAMDGFPTTAAAEAMSTGCLLVSTNVRNETRVFRDHFDYYRFEANNSDMLVSVLHKIKEEFPIVQQMGYRSANTIRSLVDARKNVGFKLNQMLKD
ncbi:glycosyltransferase [Paenibacillus sp. HJL G12]|uniref:Glycosyltransferase n=1 Tax=Paenibacillus dendrobii TaxID=2691084 RepID=A0A7X3INM9_9BACL|nr:glycosyltransferase [Paenibacillus dendrobii]MWV46621.1 glycosyltransferase [Paenibacillus dendrobii]